MKKTKIVATISNFMNQKTIVRLIEGGVDVVRLNFSHTTPEDSFEMISLLKHIREEKDIPLAILLDTKGPEVRIYGHNKDIALEKSDIIRIQSYTEGDIESLEVENDRLFYTNLPKISKLVKKNSVVLLMDGMAEATIMEVSENFIDVKLENKISLRPKAHLSIPKIDYPIKFLSKKDINDIRFAVKNDLDYIALSFVSNKEDIQKVRSLITHENANSKIKIISKIENHSSMQNLDEILNHSDGLMVARGDLGVELPFENVPITQKKIIKRCFNAGKPVITATQMLDSMMTQRRPSRAEVSDVANAAYDKTSAVMLSGETAIGKFPELVVQTMSKICKTTEESINYELYFKNEKENVPKSNLTTIVCYNAISTAYLSGAKAIIVFTKSGYSARMISKLRPGLKIYAFTTDKNTYYQMALNWGIIPHLIEEVDDFEELIDETLEYCQEKDLLENGDTAIFVGGLPIGKVGTTNIIRVVSVGDSAIIGKVIHKGTVRAPVFVINNMQDLRNKDIANKIVLLKNYNDDYIEYLKNVSGIIMEDITFERELSLLGKAFNLPVMIDLMGIEDICSDKDLFEINSDKAMIIKV